MPRSAVALVRHLTVNESAPPDVPLLRAFVSAGPVAGEAAFEELVRRHGPMVLSTCRRVLGNPHDAEDAFQATFLVLARKAATIRGNLAGWLYSVAVRTARGVRVMRDRRRKHELASGRRQPAVGLNGSDPDLASILDEEIAKLPALYREAVVLCELRGLSRKDAARELGIPEGTLSSRLSGAKRRLAALLAKRGLAAPAVLLSLGAPAAVSAALVRSAVLATRGPSTAVASAAASAVVKGMLLEQLRVVVLAAGLLMTAVCGGWAMTGSLADSPAPAPAPRPAQDPAAQLAAQLGAPEYADREAARKELRKLGSKAEAALKAALGSENPEVRARATQTLAEIRKDSLDALPKSFDPGSESPSSHPIWKRFAAVAGNSRASRDLFAGIVKNEYWLRRLDGVEAEPATAAHAYREEILAVGRTYRWNMSVGFEIFVWPCDTVTEAAYLLFLGSYGGTESAPPTETSDAALFSEGEDRIQFGKGLGLGLQGKEIAPGPKHDYNDSADLTPGSDRVFARLLAAWLPRRADPSTLYRGFELAVRHRAADVLPAARAVAADKARETQARCAALQAVAQFGASADLTLFAPLFDDESTLRVAPPRGPEIKGMPRSRYLKVHDTAIALSLLLCDQDPFGFGFTYAKDRFCRENGRPVISNYQSGHFGFSDDQSRAAAHANARAFLQEKTFEEQIKQAEAEVKRLGLVEISTFKDGIDTRFPIRFDGKGGEVKLPAGSARLVELPKPTRVMTWVSGNKLPEGIGDKAGPEFSHVLCKWSAEGKLVWVMYRQKVEKTNPDTVNLVEQLGSSEFAEREAAAKALRELGMKAESALKVGLASENAEVVARCRELIDQIARDGFFARHWPQFSKVVGEDQASRELFGRIRSLKRNIELLDAIAADPDAAGKLYHDRWKELNAANRTPSGPGGYTLSAAPLADVAGWMYLGTFPGAEGSHHQSSSLDFLPVSFHSTSRDPLPLALKDKEASAALRRLVGKWAAARIDYVGRDFGLQLALAYDISEVLPAARSTLTAKVKDDPFPGNTARNVGFALLTIGKLGTKDDLQLLEKYATTETQCAVFLHDPPPKPGQPAFHLIRPPIEGQDTTTQLRDVSIAMRLHHLGQKAEDFGFHWSWPYGSEAGKPNKLGTFHLHAIGFLRAADRDAAHAKAREWLDKQNK